MRRFPLLIITALASVWVVVAVLFYISTTASINTQTIHQDLMNMAESNASNVRHTLGSRIASLQAVASMVEGYDDYTSPEVIQLLGQLSEADGYERVAIDTTEGYTYTSDGHQFDIRQFGYLEDIKKGEPFVTDVLDALADGTPLISILVPLQNENGTPTAALRCALTTQALSDIFRQTFFSSAGYYYLVDGSGRYVSSDNPNIDLLSQANYFNDIQSLVYKEGYSAGQIERAFSHQDSGFVRYNAENLPRYAYYAPAGVNNWVVMMVVPEASVVQQSNAHTTNALILMLQIIALLLIVTVYIYVNERAAKRRALLNEKCFSVLAEQTGKMIFEWDFSDGKITCRSNFQQIFGREALTKSDTAETALWEEAVFPEDADAFRHIFATILKGEPVNDVRFRVRDYNGEYRWCALSGVVIKNEKGKPFKAIGTLEMIDEQVKKEENLRQKAETDSLTGLYNKATTEFLIRSILAEGVPINCQYALMIIDIDNFKNVNDRLGHKYGDSVLSGLAEMLHSIFRSDDIVGRVGGDEFFVFLRNIRSIQLVQSKSLEICDLFRNTYIDNGAMVNISASIGISLFPDHGTDLDALYVNADIALYNAKAHGKDTYVIYSGETARCYISNRTAIDTP